MMCKWRPADGARRRREGERLGSVRGRRAAACQTVFVEAIPGIESPIQLIALPLCLSHLRVEALPFFGWRELGLFLFAGRGRGSAFASPRAPALIVSTGTDAGNDAAQWVAAG